MIDQLLSSNVYQALVNASSPSAINPYITASVITSGYVPYIGATSNLNLGTFSLTAGLGQFGAGTNSGRQVEIFQDSANVKIGSLVGSTNYCAIYFNQTSPSVSNYGLIGTTNETYINTADISIGSSIGIRSSNSTLFLARGTASSGAVTPFTYTVPTNTGQTASTNIPNFKVTGSTKTWAAGTLATQYFNYFSANTVAFASASTATNVYGLYVEAATAGTNATITNNYAAGFSGNVISTGFYRSGTYIYAETDFRIAGAVALDYSSTTLQLGTSSFFQSLALRTNGVTRLYINNLGDIGIGVASPLASLHIEKTTTQLQLAYNSSQYQTFTINSGGNLIITALGVSNSININSYLYIQNQLEGKLYFSKSGANTYSFQLSNSQLYIYNDSNSNSSLLIQNTGSVLTGLNSLSTTATDGFHYIPTCPGTPTGTPTAYTGYAPLIIDRTNNKLYFYSGGAWVPAN